MVPHVRIVQAYGLSEFPSGATILPAEWSTRKVGSAGVPCIIADIRIVDERGEDAAPGEIGEVVIRSPATMIGYWRKDQETRDSLRDDWLHTGDAGRWDEDGFLYITGRMKDMYISGGLNVYPAEVENTITGHPGVAEVAVLSVPDESWGEVGVAVVVPQAGIGIDGAELEEFCRGRLAGYKIPKRWVISVERLPRTNSGKLLKDALRNEIGDIE
jgi:fatty-acyl-CoA synthase